MFFSAKIGCVLIATQSMGADMALGEFERHVLLFNLHIEMIPEKAKPIQMADAFGMLESMFKSNSAVMRIGDYIGDDEDDAVERDEIRPGDNVILIKDMILDRNGIAHFLLQHGDARAADPALIELETGNVRKAGKKPGEGLAHACHLMISTTHLNNTGQSRALLERVPNLGRGTVIAFLNQLLRRHAKSISYTYTDKDDNNRKKRAHPKLIAQQQMSAKLKSDLSTGKLSRIEFVKRKVVDGFEEDNLVIPMTYTIVHKVLNSPTGKKAFDLVERARVYAKLHNFDEMQIRFKKEDTGQHLSPRFSTELEDAKDVIYSRFEVLPRFQQPLEQCPKAFVNAVRSSMKTLFDNDGYWK